jgi:hypothetical protein
MLSFVGHPGRPSHGFSRREILQVGSLGVLGAAQASVASGNITIAQETLPGFGRAKRCILIYLFGAAPQHETFDPKPDAPKEIQGELQAISTSVPGVALCEGLPQTASIADRLSIVRSMTHPYPLHGTAYALTGMPVYSTDIEAKPRDPSLWPYVGSMADYYWTQQQGDQKDLLQHVGLPWAFNSQADDLGLLAGPYAAFLGQRFNPLWTQYTGAGQKLAPKCRHEQAKEYQDPYALAPHDGKFVFQGAGTWGEGLSDTRFGLRKLLLEQFDAQRTLIAEQTTTRDYTASQAQAISLLTSTQLRDALDFAREPDALRSAYGDTVFGQSCLTARRLVEAGSKFVSVFWDAYGTYFSGAWDTHQNHYPRLREYLLPGFDAAFATLIRDLDERGLLDETLIVCTTEHGRTPQIDSGPKGAARHHWSKVYSTVLAGGGVPRGKVVGRSDAIGGEVAETPVSPKDIQATALHLLGIPPHTLVHDRQGRPFPMAGAGQIREELLPVT